MEFCPDCLRYHGRGLCPAVALEPIQAAAGYVDIVHVCCVCGVHFHSATKKDARHTIEAVKVNKGGPYCELCRQLEMAARIAEARGYDGIRKAMNDWKAWADKTAVKPVGEISEERNQ